MEEYLAKGGKITKYGAQPAVIQKDFIGKWEVTEKEQEEALDDYREVDVYNGY